MEVRCIASKIFVDLGWLVLLFGRWAGSLNQVGCCEYWALRLQFQTIDEKSKEMITAQ